MRAVALGFAAVAWARALYVISGSCNRSLSGCGLLPGEAGEPQTDKGAGRGAGALEGQGGGVAWLAVSDQ